MLCSCVRLCKLSRPPCSAIIYSSCLEVRPRLVIQPGGSREAGAPGLPGSAFHQIGAPYLPVGFIHAKGGQPRPGQRDLAGSRPFARGSSGRAKIHSCHPVLHVYHLADI